MDSRVYFGPGTRHWSGYSRFSFRPGYNCHRYQSGDGEFDQIYTSCSFCSVPRPVAGFTIDEVEHVFLDVVKIIKARRVE